MTAEQLLRVLTRMAARDRATAEVRVVYQARTGPGWNLPAEFSYEAGFGTAFNINVEEKDEVSNHVVLYGDVGKWVRVNQDYQDRVPDGSIGVIVRECADSNDDAEEGMFVWRIFVPTANETVEVPRGSQVILEEKR